MDRQAKLEAFFDKESQWKDQVNVLREIALSTDVEETYKWQFPTYTVGGKNVFALAQFKDWYGIWFFQGVFLLDPLGVLTNAQEGKTKAMRHWKFGAQSQIDKKQVIAYMHEAIQNQLDGKVVKAKSSKPKTVNPLKIPPLLAKALIEDVSLATAFEELSEARKRGYAIYITEVKQESTKLKRLNKIIPLIREGKSIAGLWGGK